MIVHELRNQPNDHRPLNALPLINRMSTRHADSLVCWSQMLRLFSAQGKGSCERHMARCEPRVRKLLVRRA